MFDPETLRLIRGARTLPGLDLELLSRELTEAFATIVATRLRIAERSSPDEYQEFPADDSRMARIAATYETVALFLPEEHPQLGATAFVAAAAHHVRVRMRAFYADRNGLRPLLAPHALDPAFSAAVLYAIGDHYSDAAELARSLHPDAIVDGGSSVQKALALLLSGRGDALEELLAQQFTTPDRLDSPESGALSRLWYLLWLGIGSIGADLLGKELPREAASYFQEAITATTLEQTIIPGIDRPAFVGFLPVGLQHLALLLSRLAASFRRAAVSRLPTPEGVAPGGWRAFLSRYARARPLLWRNHRSAITEGLIRTRTSAVLSFPTGAGKSTLAELCVSAEVLRGGNVVYIAPTRALVSQVRRELQAVLRAVENASVASYMGEGSEAPAQATVTVLTPEACLMMLSEDPSYLTGVGLIVFDECHLLSGPNSAEEVQGRRSIDANLALLNVLARNPRAAAILASAMLANADELASWIGSITPFGCIALSEPWKPTRQIRGILAYDESTIEALRGIAKRKRSEGASRSSTERELVAAPWGVFCHQQIWDPKTSYRAIPLLTTPVKLRLNSDWRITANRNQVAAQLAVGFIRAGLTPLVFVQSIRDVKATAKAIAEMLPQTIRQGVAMDKESFEVASMELGEASEVVVPELGSIGLHHSLLLSWERDVVENAFARGAKLLGIVATPTLAQGMNLPVEVVILAGDNRWEPGEDGGEDGHTVTLPVHEILNAAGRAGRAGMFAHGLVLVVSGNVFTVKFTEKRIAFSGLKHAMSLLGKPDQCLNITDPLEYAMDRIAMGGELPDACDYLLRRISADDQGDGEVGGGVALTRSFGRHIAEKSGRLEEFDAKARLVVASAVLLRGAQSSHHYEQLDQAFGFATGVTEELSVALPSNADCMRMDVGEWCKWIIDYFIAVPHRITRMLSLSASGLLRICVRNEEDPEDADLLRSVHCVSRVLPLWVEGAPLVELDQIAHLCSGRRRHLSGLLLARRFSVESAPALAGIATVLRRTLKARGTVQHHPVFISPELDALASCLRLGFDHRGKFILFELLRRRGPTGRVHCHRAFARLGVAPGAFDSTWTTEILRSHVAAAAQAVGVLGAFDEAGGTDA